MNKSTIYDGSLVHGMTSTTMIIKNFFMYLYDGDLVGIIKSKDLRTYDSLTKLYLTILFRFFYSLQHEFCFFICPKKEHSSYTNPQNTWLNAKK